MKATSLFGGVQVFNILISIIRSKIVALLLGPSGMGIAGLFTSTTGLISAITGLGLGTSAVRNIAEANSTNDTTKVSLVVSIFRKLVWYTGFFGLIVTVFMSKWLSELTFGHDGFSMSFIWLSITLLLIQLTSGRNAVLQGMRKLSYLAKANLLGSVFGLLISVPLYYFYRIDGIVPALVGSSLVAFIFAKIFSDRLKIPNIRFTRQEGFAEGRNMVQMGIMLSLGSLMPLGAAFVIRVYISNYGSLEDVGLYSAGIAIITTYVGLVFTAMGKDFYPRLSEIATDRKLRNLLINQQAEIGILILAPILCVFLIFVNWIILLLYSSKFTPINGLIQWAALGIYFKVISWSIAYLLLAKGATKIYFWSELLANILSLSLSLIFYRYMGLEGLGIAYLIGFVLYLIQIFAISYRFFEFRFDRNFYKIFILQLSLGITCFLIIRNLPAFWNHILGSILIILSSYYSYRELDKMLDIRGLLTSKFRKK